jgi:hypothetical protein
MINKNLGSLPQNQIPLLFWNSISEKSVEESIEQTFNYDQYNQIVEYNCALIGTKSLKTVRTSLGKIASKQDKKNEIDDSKIKK